MWCKNSVLPEATDGCLDHFISDWHLMYSLFFLLFFLKRRDRNLLRGHLPFWTEVVLPECILEEARNSMVFSALLSSWRHLCSLYLL